ncbi:hypothetical protein Ntsu_30460 [Nocardia sp. IFM 10818]
MSPRGADDLRVIEILRDRGLSGAVSHSAPWYLEKPANYLRSGRTALSDLVIDGLLVDRERQ